MPKTGLPWQRGPAAWHVKCRSPEILTRLAATTRPSLSLRAAARLLGLSTQPLRDWITAGHISRSGSRLRLAELQRFVRWIAQHAQPFPRAHYLDRFRRRPPYPFKKLATARFTWPRRRATLTPAELAPVLRCHPSLIIKAIHARALPARRRSPHRWQITRQAWTKAFLLPPKGATEGYSRHQANIPRQSHALNIA